MNISAQVCDGPLHAAAKSPAQPTGAIGASIIFEGIVRGIESDRELTSLTYEAYDPMATDELRRLATDIVHRHGLLGLHVRHSRGNVLVGECSFRLIVLGRHRKESLAAMDEFIDRMKRDVPIWKQPIFRDATPKERP